MEIKLKELETMLEAACFSKVPLPSWSKVGQSYLSDQ